jgi:hypothetical protein
MDGIKTVEKILEEGGQISWQNKYFLIFEDRWNTNPNKEWSGYTINQMNQSNSYQTVFSSMSINGILEKFIDIITADIRKEKLLDG